MPAEEHREPCWLNLRYHNYVFLQNGKQVLYMFHSIKLYMYIRSLYKTYGSGVILKCFNLFHTLLSSYDTANKCLNSPFCFYIKKHLWKIKIRNVYYFIGCFSKWNNDIDLLSFMIWEFPLQVYNVHEYS